MGDDGMGTGSPRLPGLDQGGEIPDQRLEAVDITPGPVSLRGALPPPVEGGDVPAAAMPMILNLEIFLDEVAPPAGEEEAAPGRRAGRLPPLKSPAGPAVRRRPLLERALEGMTAVERLTVHGAGYGFESCYV